ncbi:MAG: DUF1592 domain-containing protein [Verrucomicrobia bacterium]|nr:DUF1592 domain-containing protein [Verrucomicrobiota bacterium]
MIQKYPARSLARVAAMLVLLAGVCRATAADRMERELELRFADTVHPFLQTYCFACHGEEKQKGKLDLRPYSTTEAVAKGYRQWEVLLEKLKAVEMPPEEAKRHPTVELRQSVIDWIQAMRRSEARRNVGDPGPVFARRLSNAEYDHTIRDLTGVDLRPAQEFPVDPANEAGFDNSGESLIMSPALVTKHLEAARRVAEHIVLKPQGFVFAPHPVVTETDRDKFCVKRIIDFYQQQPTDYADYFMAAWCFKHRASIGKPKATLAEFATAQRISSKYLATIWSTLSDPQDAVGPIATLRAMWRELPAPPREVRPDRENIARSGCERMRDFVASLRQKLKPEVSNLAVRGIAPGSQPLVLWKDRQMAANRTRYDPGALRVQGESTADAGGIDPALAVPHDNSARARYEAAFDRFCHVFPDAFYVSERVLVFLKEDKDSRGRLLSAGFHLMTGYFRDDAPLSELVLDEQARRELDGLWEEFHFITLDSMRQYKDFIFFERAEPPRFAQGAEFDFARSEDKDVTSEAKIKQLAEAYLAKARSNGGEGAAINAIEDYFKNISADIRRVEQARLAAEPSHLQALLAFAERAYRRPLSKAEGDDLLAFYGALRAKDGLDHEEAVRDTVASVLMSPYFCYRVELGGTVGQPAVSPDSNAVKWKAQPLSDYALASRLSYFLWSSMPDAELLARAKAGDLHRRTVLVAQTRRMLQDDRIRGLATEFCGNWLDFRRFEEHNAVDRERFKSFNNELREAMFEEPIRFMVDLVREDRPVFNFLYADYTFVNPILARHYDMPEPRVRSNEWVRVNDANRYERGGLLPMSVFLTKNAPGLRTSPVKRGYWVARRVLGERIPPPPPAVPELPNDEAKLGDLTLRETLARHRADKNCAGCHARFDALGLVFEGFGPIGERRERDFSGRPVDTHATFPGGSEGAGLDGLRRYLREHRQQEFLDNLCRKLLAYALGRSLLLSDDGIIDDMRAKLAANGYRFSSLVETIVTSPQFLNQRVDDNLTMR